MASNTLIQNITEFYVASNGSLLQIEGNQDFYPQSNYANTLYIYLEDGAGLNSATFINFTPTKLRSYTSHWFFMSYEGIYQKVIDGEQNARSFARYSIRVPNIVLQNNNKNEIIENQITFLQRYGSEFLGAFDDLTALQSEYDLTGDATIEGYTSLGEQYDGELNVVYVISTNKFYQVDYNSGTTAYEWVEVATISQYLSSKQYSVGTIFIQKGFGNAIGTQTIDTTTSQYIMQVIQDLQQQIVGLEYMKYEIYSETAFASVTRLANVVYGVYNETTGVITWYYGNVGV